ncbi:DEAD/DEAH box helicase [Paenibacillus melissococcoides]|uniref:RNA helicase n=1 Tax=Paenibacillus melissococcoides TaxID=2912268 RepID=A0ABM9FZF0_9BACL|nr:MULTISPECIES: DEAD/DEAH box helicase [Paenibacillus]CAH8244548.1 DEAD/DEAH box helicase [Paenibacillus melissococcoides]CAH8708309.1 DEAD/DEAH box helicase [Paenibacillus melissococcoides]CAH8709017.1 DEAD/DEAH box helicase [Paenibacillus melissococcoides]
MQAIPAALAGRDAVLQAQTGTGKTLAFLLPILQRIDPEQPQAQALIVAPTRELALQITAEAKKLTDSAPDGGGGIHVLAAYGGQDVEKQIRKLQGACQLVIGTPGRLTDHLRRGTFDGSGIRMLVLDEADQMLHMGFLPEVEDVISHTPASRQTLLCSATMPEPVRALAARFMRSPLDLRVEAEQVTVKEIRQMVVETTDRAKQETLFRLLDEHRPYQAVIFCRTKRRAQKLYEALKAKGYDADELHGDLTQAVREQVMKRFRQAKVQLLVATDLAARGLDVEGITHVFNYDIPNDAESYIHRIGRTGRAGGAGWAITLAAPRDESYLALIERGIRMKLRRQSRDGASVGRSGYERGGNERGESGRGAARHGSGRGASTRGTAEAGPERRRAGGGKSGRQAARRGQDEGRGERTRRPNPARAGAGSDLRRAGRARAERGKGGGAAQAARRGHAPAAAGGRQRGSSAAGPRSGRNAAPGPGKKGKAPRRRK